MGSVDPLTSTPNPPTDAGTLARLLTGIYESGVDAARAPLPDTELAARLALPPPPDDTPLLEWAARRLRPDERLTPCQQGILDSVDQLMQALWAPPVYDPTLVRLLRPARASLAGAAMSADGWITNPVHPARRVLQLLHEVACGWQPEQAPQGTKEQLSVWIDSIRHAATPDWHALEKGILAWQSAERMRLDRLENRLVDAERGVMRKKRARQLAARVLNQSLAGRDIPPDVSRCLVQDWLPAMQWVVLQEGEDSPLWQRVKRLTSSLRWTLHPELDAQENRNKLLRIVGQANEDLEELSARLIQDETARRRLQDTISDAHLAAMRGETIATETFAGVDTEDPIASGHTEFASTLLLPVMGLETGQWFRLKEGHNTTRRIRLLLRQDDAHQLLFVNAMGARALQTSFESFALLIANETAEPLPASADIGTLVSKLMARLEERHTHARQTRMEQLRAARELAAEEARKREEARLKALAEARALEAARQAAFREAEQVRLKAAELYKSQELAREADEAAAQMVRRKNIQQARLLASSMPLGTWLDFTLPDGKRLRRRLTVILSSSNKFIFVDTDGTGRFEITRDDLVTGLADKTVSPVEKAGRTDDTLTRVVNNLRSGPIEGMPS